VEHGLSALLKLLQKAHPFMTSVKYIGMDVHTEHADFSIMPTLGKTLLSTSCLARDYVF